jgi:hypothetical protein
VTLGPSRSIASSGPLCVGAGLIADGSQLGHTVLEHRVGNIGDAILAAFILPSLGRRPAHASPALTTLSLNCDLTKTGGGAQAAGCADSMQPVCRIFADRTCVMLTKSTEAGRTNCVGCARCFQIARVTATRTRLSVELVMSGVVDR